MESHFWLCLPKRKGETGVLRENEGNSRRRKWTVADYW